MPAGQGWVVFSAGPLALVWLFCYVDWDKIAPPKKEGDQILVGSVNSESGCTPWLGDIPEPSLDTKEWKLSGHLTKAASDTEVTFGRENNEEDDKLLLE